METITAKSPITNDLFEVIKGGEPRADIRRIKSQETIELPSVILNGKCLSRKKVNRKAIAVLRR